MTKILTTRELAFWLMISLMVHLLLSAVIMTRREEQRAGEQRPFMVNLADQATGISGPGASEHPARNPKRVTRSPELLRVVTAPPSMSQPLPALTPGPIPTTVTPAPDGDATPEKKVPIDTTAATADPIELPMAADVANLGGGAMEAAELSGVLSAGASSGIAGSVAPPSHATGEDPVYPPQARRKGWEGEVLLQLQVAADGSVTLVTIKRSSHHEELDLAASDAVKRWKFHPARRNGIPVEATVRLPITFRLQAVE